MPWLKVGSGKGVHSTNAFDTTSANLLIAINHGNTGSISDNKGNTWQALPTHTGGGGSNTGMFYCDTPSVGAGHYATSSVSYDAITFIAFSGAGTPAFVSETGASVGGLNTTAAPGSITPAEDGCLIITAVTHGENSSAASASGFTTDEDQPGVSGSYYGGGVAHLVQATAAAVNPTWTWTGPGGSSAAIAVFKGAPSASVLPGSAAGGAQTSGNADLAAQLNALATGAAQAAGSAVPAAQASPSAAGLTETSGVSILNIVVSLQAGGGSQSNGTANPTSGASGSITAHGALNTDGSAHPAVTAEITASGSAATSGTAPLSTNAGTNLTGLGYAESAGTGNLLASASLSAAGFIHAMGSGALSINIPLQAIGHAQSAGSANLTQIPDHLPDYLPLAPLQLIAQVAHNTRLRTRATRKITLRHEVSRVLH